MKIFLMYTLFYLHYCKPFLSLTTDKHVYNLLFNGQQCDKSPVLPGDHDNVLLPPSTKLLMIFSLIVKHERKV